MSKRVAAKSNPTKKPQQSPSTKKGSNPLAWKELILGFILGIFSLLGVLLIRYQLTEANANRIVFDLRNQSTFVFVEQDDQPITIKSPVRAFQDPKIKECSRLRWLIKSAVIKYNKRYKKMEELKVFSLMGKSYLKEMPNCPNNGKYQLAYKTKTIEVSCSHHGLSK
ncbi:hypothetical protein MJH12_09900 [bacterium]|nr:hypothetical protein [bacterium]